MTINYAKVKQQGFLDKISGLLEEFQLWRNRAEDTGDYFARHRSQILRTTWLLEPPCQSLAAKVESAVEFQPATAFKWTAQLTGLHRLWDFFRVKLAQRDVPHLRPYLRAADDLAWSLYLQLRQKADPSILPADQLKEPPLVFLDGAFSPFAQERGRQYLAEDLAAKDFLPKEMAQLLNILPVPVIGLPWQHLAHLPETLVLAHEMGHVVEDDFGLGPELTEAMGTAIAGFGQVERQKAWRYWRKEVFADLFGVLMLGPAFTARLLDFLSSCTPSVASERQGDGLYDWHPTAYLRCLLALETLDQLGFSEAAHDQRLGWVETFPIHAMTGFDSDIPKVIQALLAKPLLVFGNLSLTQLACFSKADYKGANRLAAGLLARAKLNHGDPVNLFAASQLAFIQKPGDYRRQKVDQRILDHFPTAAKPRALDQSQRSAQAWAHQEQADRISGNALLTKLSQAMADPEASSP